MSKTILIVNDDGIDAVGIKRLAREALKHGEVYVVAPDGQRSSMSHRLNYSSAMDVYRIDNYMEGVKAYSCSGNPADCVRVGIKVIGHKPDVVLSGINNGYNIATDIQYSGTVGAALEASFCGIHSIAFSQDVGGSQEVLEAYLGPLLAEYLDKKLLNTQTWNINFPVCTLEEFKGVLTDCKVSIDNFYEDDYSEEIVDDTHRRFKVIPVRNWKGTEGTDLYAICNNYISVGIVNNIA